MALKKIGTIKARKPSAKKTPSKRVLKGKVKSTTQKTRKRSYRSIPV